MVSTLPAQSWSAGIKGAPFFRGSRGLLPACDSPVVLRELHGSDHIVGVPANTAVAGALAHAHLVGGAILVAAHHGEPACKGKVSLGMCRLHARHTGTFSLQLTSAAEYL